VASLKDQIELARLPRHIAIIMDGNGRWAKEKGAERIFGHRNAMQAVRDSATSCAELGVGFLTLYAFSTENWARPQREVNALMDLLVSALESELDTLMKNNVRLLSLGNIASLPTDCQRNLKRAMDKTAGNTGLRLNLALSYSGRWELTEAVRRIVADVQAGVLSLEDITENTIATHLGTAGIPDPELIIRSGGEMRLSNFLLWQSAYAEFFSTPKYWPDFRKEDLYEAIVDFQRRERRFGNVLEPQS